MQNKNQHTHQYNQMYLEAMNSISNSIKIIESDISNEEKLSLVLRTLIASSLNCEDIF